MHAGTQSKRISIQHRIIGIDHLAHSTYLSSSSWRVTRRNHLRMLLASMRIIVCTGRRYLLLMMLPELRTIVSMQIVGRRVRSFIGIVLVEHGSCLLRIVFLFCTHGLNLGRTQFYQQIWGKLAELIYMPLKRTWIVISRRIRCAAVSAGAERWVHAATATDAVT